MSFRFSLILFPVFVFWTIGFQRSAHAQLLFWNPDDTLCQENPCLNDGVCINYRRPNVGRQPVTCSDESCYKVFETTTDLLDRSKAAASCHQHGGQLVTFENSSEQQFVVNYLATLNALREEQTTEFWTSGIYNQEHGVWFWNNVTGQVVSFHQTPPVSPFVDSTNLCLLATTNQAVIMYAQDCSQPKKYICEIPNEALVKDWTYACYCPDHYYGYHCEHFEGVASASVCEGHYLNISCPRGLNLYFEKADFGPDHDLCGQNGVPLPTIYHCKQDPDDVTQWMQMECGGQGSCELEVVANLPEFNNCPERKKLLEVKYRCSIAEQAHTQFFCERTRATLSKCSSPSRMLIEYVNYGRINKTICNVGKVSEDPYRCRAMDSLSIVAEKCNNLTSCEFKPENDLFGDPCNGVFKYVETRYRCVDDASDFTYPPVPGSVPPTTVAPVTHCMSISKLGLDWPDTEFGETAIVNCFGKEDVNATWLCSREESGWYSAGPNVTLCPSKWVYAIENLIQNVSFPAAKIAMMVQMNLGSDNDVSEEEIKRSVELIDNLLNLQRDQLNTTHGENRQTTLVDFNKAILEIGSALLDTGVRSPWFGDSKEESSDPTNNDFDKFTRLLESCSFLLADQLTENSSFTNITTKNIHLEVAKINVEEYRERKQVHFPYVRKKELQEEDNKYRVAIPTDIQKQTNSSEKLVTMSVLVYKTLDMLLSPQLNQNKSLDTSIGNTTTVVANSTSIIASVVIGISIQVNGEDVTDLGDEQVEISFNHLDKNLTGNTTCVFWKTSAKSDTTGGWSTGGCRKLHSNQTVTTCGCYHLTNFAILMDVTGAHVELSEGHTLALELLSIIGCSISIVCLLLCVVIFTCFRELRNIRTSIHRNLCFSLLVAELLFLCGVNLTHLKLVCTLVAVLLHYFFLSAFAWMCLEGVQLYVMLVHVFHTNNKILPYYIIGYGIPAIIVGVAAGANPSGYGTEHYCWLSVVDGFIWSFAGPVLFMIFVNIVFLTRALRVAYTKSSSIQKDSQKNPNIRSWIKGGITLTFLLGTTWAIGFAFIGAQTVAMAYAFTILNSLQGFFIFFFHCVGNERVKRELLHSLARQSWVPKAIKRRLLLKGQANSTVVSTAASQYPDSQRKKDDEFPETRPTDVNLVEETNDKRKTQVFFTNPMIKIHDSDASSDVIDPPRQSWLHNHGVHESNPSEYISNYPEPDYC
ncbi:latrophilin-like protein 1 isoform X2 [Apostichopus japonicus]|uniref:latrophilin-like protein 1 isoform X2 n=1 Tax=Stichopus japonicus TaxID=307972 RepID=UPI003AB88B20